MFNEQEMKEYEQDFNQLGIQDKDRQRAILTFFYTLGTIIYKLLKNL